MQKTPNKSDEKAVITPEKQSTPETNENVKPNSTLKEIKKIEPVFKTPEKANQPIESELNENETPEKPSTPKIVRKEYVKMNLTPLKELKKSESEFKTPEKTSQPNQTVESEMQGKVMNSFELKLEQTCEGDDGMISTTEQARLLIAASRTPSKSVNKTPVKQNTPSGKRSVENSPVTPGKHRRVELITLASPKAKRIKQI